MVVDFFLVQYLALLKREDLVFLQCAAGFISGVWRTHGVLGLVFFVPVVLSVLLAPTPVKITAIGIGAVIGHKARNRAMHALNGNIAWLKVLLIFVVLMFLVDLPFRIVQYTTGFPALYLFQSARIRNWQRTRFFSTVGRKEGRFWLYLFGLIFLPFRIAFLVLATPIDMVYQAMVMDNLITWQPNFTDKPATTDELLDKYRYSYFNPFNQRPASSAPLNDDGSHHYSEDEHLEVLESKQKKGKKGPLRNVPPVPLDSEPSAQVQSSES